MIFKTFTFSLVPEAIKTGSNAKFNFQGKKNCSGVLPPGGFRALSTYVYLTSQPQPELSSFLQGPFLKDT